MPPIRTILLTACLALIAGCGSGQKSGDRARQDEPPASEDQNGGWDEEEGGEEAGGPGRSPDSLVIKVRRIVSTITEMPVEKIADDATFKSLGLDELDLAELVMEIEDQFDVNVSEKDERRFVSIFSVVAYLRDKEIAR